MTNDKCATYTLEYFQTSKVPIPTWLVVQNCEQLSTQICYHAMCEPDSLLVASSLIKVAASGRGTTLRLNVVD